MKIGVISDTHIPVACDELPASLRKIFQGTDLILHAGDLIEMGVLEELKKIAPRVEAVAGNMDSAPAHHILPPKKVIKAGQFSIGLIHGWGAPEHIEDRIRREFEKIDIIVFGHTHMPMNSTKNGILFFNPGSATDKVFAKENTVGILELTSTIKATIIKI